jgi:hypothetical protein
VPYLELARGLPPTSKESLLIVSGRGMNYLWAMIWTILSLAVKAKGRKVYVLTTRHQEHLNQYFRLLDIESIYLDELEKKSQITMDMQTKRKIQNATTFKDIENIYYADAPIGQIALSTYSRYHGTGIIDLSDPKVVRSVKNWFNIIYRSMHIAHSIYENFNIKDLFFTEVFMEEYGGFYYAALSQGLNIIRFAGTNRDDAIIVQHLTKDNDRTHHASIAKTSWEIIKKLPYTNHIDNLLMENLHDRYSDKWHRSKRNQPNTKILGFQEGRKFLGIKPNRKVAVIFSHILYDTLFFFGTDLFNDYATWLIETVQAAIANPKLDWFVKVHPSNIWRGELHSLLKGKYEEEQLIYNTFGTLPEHVKHVIPYTPLSPLTWFHVADFGITVRGTAGLEMAALGKRVITAGTGRYNGNGFTVDPKNTEEYLGLLAKLPNLPTMPEEEIELAKRYAYAIFRLKPFTLHSVIPTLGTGKRRVVASDDLIYLPNSNIQESLPEDLKRLEEWIDSGECDLLNQWGS